MRLSSPLARRRLAGLVLVVALALGTWWWLGSLEPHADWLRVEAPRQAFAGKGFPVRVHLISIPEPAFVTTDLHWSMTRNSSMGYLASAGAQTAKQGSGIHDFVVPVSPRTDLRFVQVLVYLSRSGHWEDRTLVAASGLIPVSSNKIQIAQAPMESVHVGPLFEPGLHRPRPEPIARSLTATLLSVAAALAWVRGAGRKLSAPVRGCRAFQALGLALALAGAWELFGLESWLGDHARAVARAEDWYYPRVVFQKTVISLAGALMVGFLLVVLQRGRPHRLLLIACGLYAGISAVNLVSLHAIDQLAELTWHGVTLVQALKLACATTILACISRSPK